MLNYIEEKPFNEKEAKKLMIFLHGYGSNKEDLFNLKNSFYDLLPDTHFISVDAPFECEFGGEGKQWFSLKSMDIDFIKQEISLHYNIINDFIDKQVKRLNLEHKDVILIGFSQGSMMALYGSLRNTNKLLAVIAFSGVLPDTYNDLLNAIKTKQNILLIHGIDDKVVPIDYFTKTEHLLKSVNIAVETVVCYGIEHEIDLYGIKKAREYLYNLIQH